MIHTVKVLTTSGVVEFDVDDEQFLAKVLEYLQDAVNGTSRQSVLTFGQFPEVWTCRTTAILGCSVKKRTETKSQLQWSELVEMMKSEMQSRDEWNR